MHIYIYIYIYIYTYIIYILYYNIYVCIGVLVSVRQPISRLMRRKAKIVKCHKKPHCKSVLKNIFIIEKIVDGK